MEQEGCIFIESEEEVEHDDKDMDEILDFVDSKNWYSITVEDPLRHSMETTLDGLLEAIAPLEFVPVSVEGNEWGSWTMYATQCEKAIKKITSMGFLFYCRNDSVNPIQVKVIHNDPPVKKINPLKVICDTVLLRYCKVTNTLDLTDLNNDFTLLKEKIYFPLWYPGNQKLLTILIKALSLTPLIQRLDLSQNGILTIHHLNIPAAFTNIHTLNLYKNNIKSFSSLRCLQDTPLNLTSLNMDGNDLCANFIGEQNYVTCAKIIFPSLTTLDNRVLQSGGLPVIKRNSTVDWDAIPLVDKFMEIYFPLFDSASRESVLTMYSPRAILTVSGSIPSANMGGRPVRKYSGRNLLESRPAMYGVYCGHRNIVECLASLPATLHDPFSFHVDITSHSDKITMFQITGVLKVPAARVSDEEPVFEFTRTFAITSVGYTSNVYKICNDVVNFRAVTTAMSKEAFRNIPVTCDKLSLDSMGAGGNISESVKEGLIDVFIHLTEFPYYEANACLEKHKWNLRAALLQALSLMDSDNIK